MQLVCSQKQHESRLQPTLGRPGKEEEFAELCSLEEKRHEAACKLITEHTQNFKERARKNMLNFLQELGKTVKSLLHAMDAFIYPSEITGNNLANCYHGYLFFFHCNFQMGANINFDVV